MIYSQSQQEPLYRGTSNLPGRQYPRRQHQHSHLIFAHKMCLLSPRLYQPELQSHEEPASAIRLQEAQRRECQTKTRRMLRLYRYPHSLFAAPEQYHQKTLYDKPQAFPSRARHDQTMHKRPKKYTLLISEIAPSISPLFY